MKILIAEDREDDRYLLETLLEHGGYRYVSSESGKAALEILETEPVDMIISDILMMEMDGYALCVNVKQDKRFRHIPFIFISATYLTGADRAFAMSLGADIFIKKPLIQEELFQAITDLVQAVETGQYQPKQGISQNGFDSLDTQRTMMESMQKRTLELEDLYKVQKHTEKKLRQSENRYRIISSQASDFFYQITPRKDETMEIVWIGGAFEELTGHRPEELQYYTDMLGFIADEDQALFRRHMNGWRTSEITKTRYRIRPANGSTRWLEDTYQAFPDTVADTVEIIGTVKDITAQKQHEEELQLFATVVESTAESLIITDGNGIIRYVNPSFEKISGYSGEEVIGKNPRVLQSGTHPPDLYRDMWAGFAAGRTWEGKLVNKSKDGKKYEVNGSITPIRDADGKLTNLVAVQRDITHERYIEAQLRQKQKLESIGVLAGGIAHDFNNILTAIIGYTEMSLMESGQAPALQEDLAEVLKAGKRARDLVHQILAFSRKTDSALQPIAVSRIVKEAFTLLRASIPTTIDIKLSIKSDAMIMGDATQIHQIVMNLATNAAQALTDGHGRIIISLKNIFVDEDFRKRNPELQKGHHLLLEVLDNGCGMSQETLSFVFDPFFTTKKVNEGTGLGLSTVYGIVKSHLGTIHAYSEVDKGSVFKVILPIIMDGSLEETNPDGSLSCGNENILLVDDEAPIARLFSRILKSMGYRVTPTDGSPKGLEQFKSDPAAFDLVITDMTMPVMTGLDLARELIALRKDIPIIICTGYSEGLDKKDLKKYGIRATLMKPVNKIELARVVREVLDASGNC
ncbi:MAG: response regulator [Desulfobacter sp.]